jgi:hypothetical protein
MVFAIKVVGFGSWMLALSDMAWKGRNSHALCPFKLPELRKDETRSIKPNARGIHEARAFYRNMV